MTDPIARELHRHSKGLSGRLSLPGDERYAAATAIWAKPLGGMPRAVAHCRTPKDVQAAIHAARNCDLPLSVRGGGHDWAGRALCEGIVIDLSEMREVAVGRNGRTARIAGGARAGDVLDAVGALGLVAVTGSVGAVGMAGLTLGGGYGPLIGRFGLALDNLLAAQVVLADGRVVAARDDSEEDLFWALRGGGGNFGVVTEMQLRLHELSTIRSGMLIYPFSEAEAVLTRCAEISASARDELTVQLGIVHGPDGAPAVLVMPTWCGAREVGESQVAPFLKVGTLLAGAVEEMPYRTALTSFDPYLVYGQPTIMETCWLPVLDRGSIEAMVAVMESAVSPGCAVFTHEFRGAASRISEGATAFGLRRDHVLIEILATFPDRADERDGPRHHQWVQAALAAFAATALPGGYPNLLPGGDAHRAAQSFGRNAGRLAEIKRRYDRGNLFRSAIPLPPQRTAEAADSDDRSIGSKFHLT